MEKKRHSDLTTNQVRERLLLWFFTTLILTGVLIAISTLLSFTVEEAYSAYEWERVEPTEVIELEFEETVSESKFIWWDREYKEISFIVIHHTATRDDLTADEMELSMRRTYINNRWWKVIPTHYIIDKRGNLSRVNPLNKIVWATLNPVANAQWIHIELVWDFNQHNPTDYQYDTLNSLIKLIEDEVGSYLPIKWHKDFQAKNCPWDNFDWGQIWNSRGLSVWDVLYFDKITAYYTPLPTDTIFSHWTYEASKKVNWDFVNAMGWDYKEDHKYTHGACWRRFEFGTILHIEWRWDVVCVDRGSAIDNSSFDIRYWIGEKALSEIRGWKIHPQKSKITVVYLP